MNAKMIPVDRILPNPEQPRKLFQAEELEELAASMRGHGVIQAISVEGPTPGPSPFSNGENGEGGEWYILEDGERRWRAAMLAGLTEIPATVQPSRNGHGSRDRLERALVANIQRAEMGPYELGMALMRLRDEHGLSVTEIGRRMGKRKNVHVWVKSKTIWAELEAEIGALVDGGKLPRSVALAEALLTIPSREARVGLAIKLSQTRMGVAGAVRACGKLREALASPRRSEAPRPPHFLKGENGEGGRTGASPAPTGPGLDVDWAVDESVMAGRLAVRQSRQGQVDRLVWDALRQAGQVPPFAVVRDAILATCRACILQPASEAICRDCPLPQALAAMIDAPPPSRKVISN